MEVAARLLVAFSPILLAALYPLIALWRGASFLRAFLVSWGLIVVFCFLIPFLIFPIQAIWGDQVAKSACSWLPELTAVVPMIFFGWFYALIIATLGKLVVWIIEIVRGQIDKGKMRTDRCT